MGQQQLLLVILTTIIVGIATLIAINTFGLNAEKANMDAVRQDLVQIATAVEAWKARPAAMGGGNNMYGYLSFNNISFPATTIHGSNGFIVSNLNGTYWIRSSGAKSYSIRAFPAHIDGYIPGATPGEGWFEMLYFKDEIRMSPELNTLPSRNNRP